MRAANQPHVLYVHSMHYIDYLSTACDIQIVHVVHGCSFRYLRHLFVGVYRIHVHIATNAVAVQQMFACHLVVGEL